MSILNHDNESDGFRSLISCLCFYPASNITHLTYVQTGDSPPWITSLSGSRPSNASCSRPVTSTQHILSKWPTAPTSAQTRNSNSILLSKAHACGSADVLRNDNNYKIMFDLILFFGFLCFDACTKSTLAFCRGKGCLQDWWLPYLTALPLLKLIRKKTWSH